MHPEVQRDRISAEAEALAFGPRYANGHASRSRSVGFAETRDSHLKHGLQIG
ncbi:hypothetical protein [Moorena sp. SIO4G3]|uniref:hypothetical protein n=1 Tax=Moorena sp. SIO4G3 TaxID=2607821 RepID=UPI00142BC8D8|nr:hypothetical protein [Moorena sp. SIO4G3]NEO82457.1 hypothetical protein [Moorena sp. SIO4G3]